MTDWTLTPILIALGVGAIGVVGLFGALRAAFEIGQELDALRRGGLALSDLQVPQESMFDYLEWVNDLGPELASSHFTDHLLAAAHAAKSGRAISLQELHEISARREARRISARLSGGITALLLICGIAGTLWAIKPLLGHFTLDASPAGVVQGAANAEQATRLIRDLGNAFWPSLVALALTVLVASARGVYALRRGHLASKLDRLDLEDLFPRFPPPSISRELDEIRGQLGELVARMLASQSRFDWCVKHLSSAAKLFHTDAESLRGASMRFVDASEQITPRLDALTTTVVSHLGAGSPIVSKLDGVAECALQIQSVAQELKSTGELLKGEMTASRDLLDNAVRILPDQLKDACHSASTIIATSTSNALSSAYSSAVQQLDQTAAPLCDAARTIVSENQALRSEMEQSVDAAAMELLEQSEGIKKHIAVALQALDTEMSSTLDTIKDDVFQGLQGAVAEITKMHGSATDAIAKSAATLTHMRQLQDEIAEALAQSTQNVKQSGQLENAIHSATNQVVSLTRRIDTAMAEATSSQALAAGLTQRLEAFGEDVQQGVDSSRTIRASLEEIFASQQDETQRVATLANQVDSITADWRTLQAQVARRGEELARLLGDGDRLAGRLGQGIDESSKRQEQLAIELASLNEVLTRIEKQKATGFFQRLIGKNR